VFGPVWAVLYALMDFAFWRVLALQRQTPWRSLAIAAFAVQLVLNLAWSWVFFGLHSPLAAFVVILLLLALILACILIFRRMDRTSALAMMPYALWVLYALTSMLQFGGSTQEAKKQRCAWKSDPTGRLP
jgi:tryptophan-rich sensory protein